MKTYWESSEILFELSLSNVKSQVPNEGSERRFSRQRNVFARRTSTFRYVTLSIVNSNRLEIRLPTPGRKKVVTSTFSCPRAAVFFGPQSSYRTHNHSFTNSSRWIVITVENTYGLSGYFPFHLPMIQGLIYRMIRVMYRER